MMDIRDRAYRRLREKMRIIDLDRRVDQVVRLIDYTEDSDELRHELKKVISNHAVAFRREYNA